MNSLPFLRHVSFLRLLFGLTLLCPLGFEVASAQTSEPVLETVSGVPVVEESGLIILNGQKIALWGLDTLARDQQCWQEETAWDCGQQATTALRHFVDGRTVECELLQLAQGENPALGRCFRYKGPHRIDIGGHLVARGWAMDKGDISAGLYAAAEEAAQADRRGIWGSRFQTPQDWHNGIQRFIGESAPAPETP